RGDKLDEISSVMSISLALFSGRLWQILEKIHVRKHQRGRYLRNWSSWSNCWSLWCKSQPLTGDLSRPTARWAAYNHNRCRKLSGVLRRNYGPRSDERDGETGCAVWS